MYDFNTKKLNEELALMLTETTCWQGTSLTERKQNSSQQDTAGIARTSVSDCWKSISCFLTPTSPMTMRCGNWERYRKFATLQTSNWAEGWERLESTNFLLTLVCRGSPLGPWGHSQLPVSQLRKWYETLITGKPQFLTLTRALLPSNLLPTVWSHPFHLP